LKMLNIYAGNVIWYLSLLSLVVERAYAHRKMAVNGNLSSYVAIVVQRVPQRCLAHTP
jgi:hypothetical protein